MKIDITREPPTDIYRDRSKYLCISLALLFLISCAALLMWYGVDLDNSRTETIENTGLILFVGLSLIFAYFSEKLKAYKRLGPQQKKELTDLAKKHPEIFTYCALVEKAGRAPILAEYKACKAWVEDLAESAEVS